MANGKKKADISDISDIIWHSPQQLVQDMHFKTVQLLLVAISHNYETSKVSLRCSLYFIFQWTVLC